VDWYYGIFPILLVLVTYSEQEKGMGGKKIHGGTTVSGTMILSHLAGIKVFATGGLGRLDFKDTILIFLRYF
jgi:hypothetical protein